MQLIQMQRLAEAAEALVDGGCILRLSVPLPSPSRTIDPGLMTQLVFLIWIY